VLHIENLLKGPISGILTTRTKRVIT
jgi:hypothetical protein